MLRFLREQSSKFANVQRHSPSRRPNLRRTRIRCEELEDRLAPATFVVNVPGDPLPVPTSGLTLRSALTAANNGVQNDIVFNTGGADNILLAPGHGPLVYTGVGTLNINANGVLGGVPTAVTVNGAGLTRDFVITPSVNVNFIGSTNTALPFQIINGRAAAPTPNGGGIDAESPNAVITLQTVTVQSNNATGNGAGVFTNGTLSVRGSRIIGNVATGNGGGLFAAKSLIIDTSTLTNNRAANGGAAFESTAAPVTITNSTFTTNSATTRGGAVFATMDVNATTSSFSGNTAGVAGGAINAQNGSATLNGDTITNNRASNTAGTAGNGGGVWANRNVIIQPNAAGAPTLIDTNTAGLNGGGVFSNLGQVIVIGGAVNSAVGVHGNTASTGSGGNIWSGGNVLLTNATVNNGTALVDGGGIFTPTGDVTATGSTVSGNSTQGNGGGIAAEGAGSTVTLTSTNVSTNAASVNGGGVYVPLGTLNTGGTPALYTLISNNVAGGNGGGIYIGSGTANLGFYTSIDSNLANSGGGLYVDSGGAITTISQPTWAGPAAVAPNYQGLKAPILIINNTSFGFGGVNALSGGAGGGGFAIVNGSSIQLYDTLVAGNTADGDGSGGLIVNTPFSDLEYDSFINNTSLSGNGGGLAVEAASTLGAYFHIDDSTFGSTTAGPIQGAGGNGGALYLLGVTGDSNHNTFNDNQVTGGASAGAAIFADAGTSFFLENTLVDDTRGLSAGIALLDGVRSGGIVTTLISMGHNLTSDNSLSFITNFQPGNGDLTATAQALAPLANAAAGGFTPVYILLAGPANGAGDPAGPFINQNGGPRPPHNIGSV